MFAIITWACQIWLYRRKSLDTLMNQYWTFLWTRNIPISYYQMVPLLQRLHVESFTFNLLPQWKPLSFYSVKIKMNRIFRRTFLLWALLHIYTIYFIVRAIYFLIYNVNCCKMNSKIKTNNLWELSIIRII